MTQDTRVRGNVTTAAVPRVTQLASEIRGTLRGLGGGMVEGEVQNMHRASSGHVYFSLADDESTIDCTLWRGRAGNVEHMPTDGTLVQIRYDKVDFFGRRGAVSLHVDRIRLAGEGELLARRQATLKKLQADGLVDRARRSLPAYPRRVGVIAAAGSDAKKDVITALRARWPSVHIVFRGAIVEGVRTVESVIDAVAHLQDVDGVDVIILARGGGSVQSLVAFDDERLCRAVFACAVPVVTSIGHTKDRPNVDHCSAAFSDVPAKAAELVVPSAAEARVELDRHAAVLAGASQALTARTTELANLWAQARPEQTVQRRTLELDAIDRQLEQQAGGFYAVRERTLDNVRHRLARVRSAMPAPTAIDLPAQRLRAAGEAFFASRLAGLDSMRTSVARTPATLPRIDDIAGLGQRLRFAAARARQRQEHEAQASSELGCRLTAAAGEVLADARKQLGHTIELIQAKDFRRSGWILASNTAGKQIRSASQLEHGEELRLHFHDGVAEAAVTNINTNQQGENHYG